MINSPTRQASTTIVLMLSIASLAWYAAFLFSGEAMANPFTFMLLCIAEIIGMSQLLGLWLTVLLAPVSEESAAVLQARKDLSDTHSSAAHDLVAVLIPVAGEPITVIRRTVTAARDMDVKHRTVILDDGESDSVRTLARELGVEYIRRTSHEGRKAGNLNNGLKSVHSRFFAIFDSDHVPHRSFLTETLPYLLADEKMAFVQTPQSYGNRLGFISGGSADMQDAFYRHVQPGKNAFNAAFCVGTNVIFRREAIDEIGGMYQASNSEDIWTSILLHERGWKSQFLAKVLAVGLAPETLGDFFRQQFRWARGGLEILFGHNPLFRPLSLDQKLQYLHTTMHYLSAIPVAMFYFLPLLYAYFGLKPITVDTGWQFMSRFLPYYAMFFLSTAHLNGAWPRWRMLVTGVAAFPAHIAAGISVLTGFNMRWSVTGVIKNRTDYIMSVSPHLVLLALSLGAVPLILLTEKDPFAALWIAFWLIFNSITLFSVCKRAFPRFSEAPLTSTSSLQYAHSL